jgi:hypothetical protein
MAADKISHHTRYLWFEHDVKTACVCLVKLENDRVRLSHCSVKQFLFWPSEFIGDQPEDYTAQIYVLDRGH